MGNTRLSYTFDTSTSSLKVLEENHYYPFGLKHQNYNSSVYDYQTNGTSVLLDGVYKNRFQYKYNGKEFQDEFGLNWYAYGYRHYDPAIARWHTSAPLLNDLKTTIDFDQKDEDDDETDMLIAFTNKMEVGGGVYNPYNLNPYGYGYNNPVSYDDPDGRCPWCIGALVGAVTDYGLQVAGNLIEGKSLGDALTQVDGKSILTSAVSGATGVGLATKLGKATTLINKVSTAQKAAQKVNNVQKATSATSKTTKISSKYEQATKSSRGKESVANRKTDVSKKDFEKNLKKSGYEKTKVNDKVTKFEKDGKSYTTRPDKNGKPSADFRKDATSKQADLKIRLESTD